MKPDEVILDPGDDASRCRPASPPRPASTPSSMPSRRRPTANANAANDVFAHEAIRLVAGHLERAVSDGSDLEAREGLQRAAAFAGVAIDNCGTAVAHMIGHALASLRPIHHGRSVALGMIATLAWNIEGDDGRFDAAARAMGVPSAADLPRRLRGADACRRHQGLAGGRVRRRRRRNGSRDQMARARECRRCATSNRRPDRRRGPARLRAAPF